MRAIVRTSPPDTAGIFFFWMHRNSLLLQVHTLDAGFPALSCILAGAELRKR